MTRAAILVELCAITILPIAALACILNLLP